MNYSSYTKVQNVQNKMTNSSNTNKKNKMIKRKLNKNVNKKPLVKCKAHIIILRKFFLCIKGLSTWIYVQNKLM